MEKNAYGPASKAGGHSPSRSIFVGRERERRLLDGLLGSVDGSGSAIVILGEAGMGKTSLLEFVQDSASRRGILVRTVRGAESEVVLPFAAVADLLLPLREYLTLLPAVQREALEACLALSAGPAHGPLAACAGTLGVLAAAADEQPLAIVVDDLQWIDPESAQILLFVARRLAPEHVVMVLAVREEPDMALPVIGLPVLPVAGLSRAECAELADKIEVTITPTALTSLVESTGGNPLAVVEQLRVVAAGGLDEDWWEGSGPPALHTSLERTWGRLVDQLTDDERVALFVVAADHTSGGSHTVEALSTLGVSLRSLAGAERLGLVAYQAGEIRLRHPLLRSVILARTPLATRVSAYRALADVADGHARVLYLAAAAIGPDEGVASALVAAAGEARRRNGLWASARTLHRAAELTDDRLLRAERLLKAAYDAHLAGDLRAAVTWCEQALTYRNDPCFMVDVERVAGRARTWLGDPSHAFQSMTAAAASARRLDPARAAEVLAEATAPAALQGHLRIARAVAQQVEDIWNDSADAAAAATPTVLAMVAESFVMSGELHRAKQYLRRAADLLASSNSTIELQGAAFLAQGLLWAERYPEARVHLAGVLGAARRLAAPSILSFALGVSAELEWWTGQWTTAYADATEALQWAAEYGQPALVGYSLGLLARFEAGRGEREACESHVDQSRREVEPRGVGCIAMYNSAALGLAALSVGDQLQAIKNLEFAWDLAGQQGLGNPNVVPFAGDLAEVLARAGQVDRYKHVGNWLDDRARATGLAYPRAAACRARGILATDPDEAQSWFAESLESLGRIGPIPFEEARTLLCSGEALRRARRPAAARTPLDRALNLFDGLGARPWSARARAELAASGVRAPRITLGSRYAALEELSPQELQVGRAAGRGLNNIEVAAALFVSRKTVEAHLTRVYRKLGVRSRTELARVLLANGISD
jgi:DNA-binding CsgD family transcriptional regulator